MLVGGLFVVGENECVWDGPSRRNWYIFYVKEYFLSFSSAFFEPKNEWLAGVPSSEVRIMCFESNEIICVSRTSYFAH